MRTNWLACIAGMVFIILFAQDLLQGVYTVPAKSKLLSWRRLARFSTGTCKALTDPKGKWNGSLEIGGVYTLICNTGFRVPVSHGNRTSHLKAVNVSCQENLLWPTEPTCQNVDDCNSLRHGCGAQGICEDGIEGYRCNCETGVPLVLAQDDSGEYMCEEVSGVCEGKDCSAHGLCVDLAMADEEFDTGNNTGYKCSCESGYYDDGETCKPMECGKLEDRFGTWEGVPNFGELYTLRCDRGSFISGAIHQLRKEESLQCPAEGVWPREVPRCVNAWQEAKKATLNSFRFYMAIICAAACVLAAALAAGLTMGLVSIEPFDLRLKMAMSVDEAPTLQEQNKLRADQQAAKRLLPLKEDHHLLLVTLLLLNSLANEALPIFLDQLVPSWAAVLLSVTCVLFFGEIFPSAVFTGPQQLTYAACFAPAVRFLTCLLWPIAKPIALLLDKLIGSDHADSLLKYDVGQLEAILKLHETDPGNKLVLARSASSVLSRSNSHGYVTMRLEDEVVPVVEDCGPGLHPVASRMAQGCLRLPAIRIEDLRSELEASAQQLHRELSEAQTQTRITPDMSVMQAIELMMHAPPGARASIVGMQAKVTLDELVRAAVLPNLGHAGGH